MAKGKRKGKGGASPVTCEAFVDDNHGHLVLFILDRGTPVVYRQFWCARKHRNDRGRFVARGFRKDADEIMEIIERPAEELAISQPNCDRDTYTKLSVGCSKKNPTTILKAMQADRDDLIEEYGISEEDLAKDSKRRVRRRSFVEWLFATETEAEHDKCVAERAAERKTKREQRRKERGRKADGKKDEKADEKEADKTGETEPATEE